MSDTKTCPQCGKHMIQRFTASAYATTPPWYWWCGGCQRQEMGGIVTQAKGGSESDYDRWLRANGRGGMKTGEELLEEFIALPSGDARAIWYGALLPVQQSLLEIAVLDATQRIATVYVDALEAIGKACADASKAMAKFRTILDCPTPRRWCP